MGFTLIVEPTNEMNKRLEQLIQDGTVSGKHGEYIDCRSMITRDNVSGTITTTVDHNINFVAGDSDEVPPQEPSEGNTMQNYAVEREVLNATADGCATTLTTAHHYSGNIIDPKRGQKEMGVKETTNSSFRIRKLTPRTCFRLMGVDEADIDKIYAAGISKSQQYKLAGNSIVVDVLEAIFRKMFIDPSNEDAQLMLF